MSVHRVLPMHVAFALKCSSNRGGTGADASSVQGLEAFLKEGEGATELIAATCFAIGSTLFCYLFRRARTIPVSLAWLGLISSVLLVIGLPLQILGFVQGGMLIWMPMLVFENLIRVLADLQRVVVPQPRSVRTA